MCREMSAVIILKDECHKALWSKKSDHHENIINEFNLNNLDNINNIQLVRVEITPPDNDFTKPFNEWIFETDQDIMTEWYDEIKAEEATRLVLPLWAKSKIVFTDEEIDILDSYKFLVLGTVNKVNGGTVNEVNGGTVITYTELSIDILKSSNSVIVDRSGNKVVCYIGNNV